MPHAHLSPRAVVDSEWEGFGHVLTMSSVFWGNNTNGKRKFGECASLPQRRNEEQPEKAKRKRGEGDNKRNVRGKKGTNQM